MNDTPPSGQRLAESTPGPWTTRDTHDNGTEVESMTFDGRVVATVYPRSKWFITGQGTDPVQEANANLIASAPDLLAALQQAVNGFSNLVELGIVADPFADETRKLEESCRLAIARATGQTS